MAKQTGIIPLTGSLDNISFYHDKKNGNIARRKGGASKQRIKNDPAFARTRECMSDFSTAASSGAAFRRAFLPHASLASGSHTNNDVHKLFASILKHDQASARGEKRPSLGDLSLFEEFEWNRKHHVHAIMPPPVAEITAASALVHIPAIAPGSIAAPAGATHYEIKAVGAYINFDQEKHESVAAVSDKRALSTVEETAFTLTLPLSAVPNLPAFIAVGISFYQKLGKLYAPLKEGHAFSVIKVIQ